MSDTLYAGAARRIINPPLGTRRPGIRLFADPIEEIESDLTATAVVLSNKADKVAIIALDLLLIPMPVLTDLRQRVGEAIGTPASHVMINFSHTHSGPAFPDWIHDTPEQIAIQRQYQDDLLRWIVEAASEANQNLQEARIGAGRGEAYIGVYRRELDAEGRDHLGWVPEAPIDPSVGVIRVDDLEGQAIATLFSYGCHPVVMGPRSRVASSDYPGAARQVIEDSLGGLSLFLQGCAGNINPFGGIGYEQNGRDAKNRLGMMLGGEVVKVAAGIRTHVRLGERTRLSSISTVSFWPWEPVTGATCNYLGALEDTVKLEYIDLPTLEEAQAIDAEAQETLAQRQAGDAEAWEVEVATRWADWSGKLVEAVKDGHPTLETIVQAIRVNDIVLIGINLEVFFETGMTIKEQSPFEHTQVMGYTNGVVHYLPRAEDYPPGGWSVHEQYATPDMRFQQASLPVAFRPDSEQKVVARTLELIRQLD